MRRLILILSITMAAPLFLFPQIFDFQVNTTSGSIGIQHSFPRLVPRPDGGVLVVWLDQRNGTDQVFGRIYSADGRTVGKDILISDQPLELDSDQPVGCDASGRLVMARIEYYGNGYQVYARRFSAEGDPVGSYFRIDDDPTGSYKSNCVLACDSAGGFAAVWSDTRNGRSYDLYLQRFDAEGRPITRNIRVNNDETDENHRATSLALDSQGRCAVVWITGSICLQQFSPSGSAVGQNIRVAGIGWDAGHPRVCIDGRGNAAVLHYPNTKSIFAISRFSEKGEPLDRTEFDQLDEAQQDAMIFLRPDGTFLLAWDVLNEVEGSSGLTESALRYRLDGTVKPDIFRVRSVPDDFCSTQDILLRQDGTSFYSWTGQDQHVYVQCCDSTGKTRYGAVKACSDTLGSSCGNPSIGVAPDGGFTVAWSNWGGHVDRELIVRAFDANGEPRTQDVSAGANYALYPAVTSGPAGDFNVFWKVAGYRVEGRHFNGNAVPGDSIHAFSDMATCVVTPRAASNSAGSAVVVWQGDPDFEGEQTDVCGRRCSADGLPLGPVIRVNEFPSEDYSYTQPRVAVAGDGGFMVVWTETDARRMVRARLYNPDGEALGASFDVLPFQSDEQWDGEAFVIAESGGGYSVFIFGEQTLRGVRLLQDGSPAGDPKTLIEDEAIGSASRDMDRDSDGRLVVALLKNDAIIARVFDADWSLLGKPFILTEGASIGGYSFSAKMSGGRIYAVWEDRRSPERGNNIWASVTDAATGIRISKTAVPAVISLGSNYPNPFNPVTSLSYELARPVKVTLAVFDARGRRVRTLETGFAQAGRHESRWDGRNDAGLPMPSGMYVFRLTSDGVRLQHKAMLLR